MTLGQGQVSLLTRSEFAQVCRITPRTIRFYEKLGLLKPSYINPANKYHYYDVKQLEHVTQIKLLQQFNLSLKDILLSISQGNTNIPFDQKLTELQQEIEAKQKEYAFLSTIRSYLFTQDFEKEIREEYVGPYTLLCRYIEKGDYHKLGEYFAEARTMATTVGIHVLTSDLIVYLDPIFKPKATKMEICLICSQGQKLTEKLPDGYFLKSFSKTRVLSFEYKGPYAYLIFIDQKFNEYITRKGIRVTNPVFEIDTVTRHDTACEYDWVTKVCYPI